MAFSMFLRAPACTSRVFSQQIMRLATQQATKPVEAQRMLSSIMPLQTSFLKSDTTPILNAVRSFRTSPALLHEEKAHDHSKLWVIEKLTSAALVPLIPICLMIPNRIFDSVLAILITAHSFWGLEAIAVDYVRASIFGPIIPKIAIALVYLISIATLGGLFYLISNDVGLSNAIRQLWGVKSKQNA
ncbi:succinate dehydrogenase [ubiquinone] cytochrome b small subunit, mitochondrial isoform X2 [Pieris napi]|uniref:succinate dehydrogenase [ubiquinone] cytochrome b small subunit, mitochondrial isoform X2 n=1 Tax=Pieris napi TaxID=78633 RepID=UPI001FB8B92B|nr:succinate dehydrogenase [ubiquinone] cytochrome b small subunit, mitochondrial isoform X2 [Pieris napi]